MLLKKEVSVIKYTYDNLAELYDKFQCKTVEEHLTVVFSALAERERYVA